MGPKAILMHLALIPDSGAVTGYTVVALPVPLFNIVLSLEPVIPILGRIQGTVDTEVT
jgi:hypothetical protein